LAVNRTAMSCIVDKGQNNKLEFFLIVQRGFPSDRIDGWLSWE
jgi:hypothetical protein